MKKRDKIINFLVKPPMWVCITVWVLFLICVGVSNYLYFVGFGLKLWALPVYIVALVLFILSVYAVLTVVGLPKRASNSPKVKRFFSSYDVRAFVYAACSVIFNLCYIVFGIIIAVLEKSIWLGALVGYHVFLIIPRVTVFYLAKLSGGDEKNSEIQNARAYAYCGFALTLLAVAIIPVIRLVLQDRNTYNYFVSGIVYVTAIAAYSFTKLGISLYNLKKVRKSADMSLKAIKNVSFADALISIFALQAMMLKELSGDTDPAVMNPVIGGLVALGIFVMGVYMMVHGFKSLKRVSADEAEKAAETEIAKGGIDGEYR